MNEIQKTQLLIDALKAKVDTLKAIDNVEKSDIPTAISEKETLLASKKSEFEIKHKELKELRVEINSMIDGLLYLRSKK